MTSRAYSPGGGERPATRYAIRHPRRGLYPNPQVGGGLSGAALSVSPNASLRKAFGGAPKAACETQALPETNGKSTSGAYSPLFRDRVTHWKRRRTKAARFRVALPEGLIARPPSPERLPPLRYE